MPFSDKWTRTQIRAAARREIMDTGTRWWTDAELNQYIDDWQDRVQSEHELVVGTATQTLTGSTTMTLTDLATDILRVDAVYWNNNRLGARSKDDLNLIDKNWRGFGTGTQPTVVYQDSFDSITVWPPVASTAVGTVIIEYPRELSFATDTSTMELPAWTRYTSIPYIGFRAFVRRGQNENPARASRYKAVWQDGMRRVGRHFRRYFPKKAPRLRPGMQYEKDILDPFRPLSAATLPSNVSMTLFEDEVPTGTINGTNTAFTLTNAPNPADSLELQLDGAYLHQGEHYSISSNTIDMSGGTNPVGAPVTGQSLFAHYRYTS